MIVVRLAQGAWAHAGARVTEWIGLYPLAGLGVVLWDEYNVFGISPSFSQLREWGSEAAWANGLLAAAVCRLFALFVNGYFRSFRHSPCIRFIASCIAALAWSAFASAFYIAWKDFGGSPTAAIAYSTLVLLELRNAYVSRVDMAYVAREARNARAGR